MTSILETFAPRIEREIAVNAEFERCASIMRAVGLYVESFRGDRDGYVVELATSPSAVVIVDARPVRVSRRVTSGFGLTICAAFEAAAKEHRS